MKLSATLLSVKVRGKIFTARGMPDMEKSKVDWLVVYMYNTPHIYAITNKILYQIS